MHPIRDALCPLALLILCAAAPAQCIRYWQRVTTTITPSPRIAVAAATFGNEAVFFGGQTQTGVSGELWTWNGSSWSPRAVAPPNLARANAPAIIFTRDSAGPRFSVFGGIDANLQPTNTLVDWSPSLGFAGPFAFGGLAARFNHAWVGNAAGTRNLMVGGGTCAGLVIEGRIWDGFGGQTVPLPNFDFGAYRRTITAMAWDTTRDRVYILQGNVGTSNACTLPDYSVQVISGDPFTASWQLTTNSPVPARASHAAAYAPPPYDQIILFGGESQPFPSSQGLFGDTWSYSPALNEWVQVQGPGPSPRRANNALVWVPGPNHFVLFGGHDGGLSPEGASNGGLLGDTWVLRFDPVVNTNPVSRLSCNDAASFTSSIARSPASAQRWQYRRFIPATGQWTPWRLVAGSAGFDTCEPASLREEEALPVLGIANQCTEQLDLTRGPRLPRAGIVEVRSFVVGGCPLAQFNSAVAQWTFLPDLNADNAVNTADLIDFLSQFGVTTLATQPFNRADFNGDDAVNTPDLVFLLANFGRTCL